MADERTSGIEDVELDSRALFGALGRSLPVLIPFVAVVALAVFFGLGLLTPRYTAQSMILIQQGESSLTQASGDTEEVRSLLDSEGVASQVQLISSRDLASRVVSQLDLASLPEFDRPSVTERIQAFLSRFRIVGSAPAITKQERALQRFGEALQVYSVDKTRVITVAFSSSDPELAARVANAVADEYLALDRAAKRQTTADATRWLDAQISSLRVRVSDSESKVEAFRTEHGLFMGGQNGNQSLAQQRLDDLNTEFARLEVARSAADAKAQTIRARLAAGGSLDMPEVLDSQLIQRLLEQQVALRAQIAQLSATLLSNHPRIRELNAQLADLDGQVRSEARRILTGLEGEVQTAKARESEITKDLQRAKAQTAESNGAEVQLRALEREATAQRDLLESYLRRYREATSRQDGDYLPADARVISRATAPLEPSFPRRIPMTAAVSVAVLLLAITFVLLRELLSGRALRPVPTGSGPRGERVREPMPEWEEDGGVRRMMPANGPGPAFTPATGPTDRLRPLIDRLCELEARRIIVVPAESLASGRPLAAVALARQLSRRGTRVLLLDLYADGIDGDAMNPTEEKLPGLSELFAGSANFAQTIFRDRYSRAHLIPRGNGDLPDGLAATARFGTILDALDHTYEHVLIDVDPDLAAGLAADAAAIVLVAEESLTEEKREAAVRRFRQMGPAEVLVLTSETAEAESDEAAVA